MPRQKFLEQKADPPVSSAPKSRLSGERACAGTDAAGRSPRLNLSIRRRSMSYSNHLLPPRAFGPHSGGTR